MDLMKVEDGIIKFIASRAVAKAAIIGMHNSPLSLVFNKLSDNILLLQSLFPVCLTHYSVDVQNGKNVWVLQICMI